MSERTESLPIPGWLQVKGGIHIGIVVFGSGVGFMMGILEVEVDDGSYRTLEAFAADAGRLFYSSHYFVDVETGDGDLNYITQFDFGHPAFLLYFVPVLLLIYGGYFLAAKSASQEKTGASLAGTSLLIGYFPLVVVGTQVFSWVEPSRHLEPVFLDSLVFAGILYPVVFGAIGGYLWFVRQRLSLSLFS